MTKSKKILSIILAVMMVLSILPSFGLTVWADSGEYEISWNEAAESGSLDATYGSDDFLLTRTDNDNKHSIDANTARFGTAESYKTFDYRLKTNAKSSSKNSLKLTVKEAGTLSVYVKTGSNTATDRNLVLTQGDTELYNKVVQESDAVTVDGVGKVYPVISVEVQAGDIEITYPVNSLNFYGFSFKVATAETSTVSFTKATSADDITAENIGTCAAEDAKSWILANWDAVTDSYAAVIAFYSNTGELNVVWFYCGLTEEEFSNDFDNYINTTTSISDIQQGFDTSASVFICTAAAPVTEWHIGDPINLGGKYYINDDQGAPSSYGFDRDVIVSEPVYETMYNQWIFENVIASNASEAYALYISLPTGKTASDVPTGFKVKSGDGTEASPYEFELVYAAAATAYAGYVPAEADDADALAAKVVKFNGYDWYLIEDNSTSETEGTVTLFAKDTIGSSRFDNSNNVYSGSMVKSYLDNLTAEGGAFADVADAIVSTALEDVNVTGAKLWLLSKDEVITTYKLSTALNKCSNDWWLRTPATSSYVIYVNGTSGSVVNSGNFHMNTYGVRPALNLDLSKVEFDSTTNTFALPQPLVEYSLWVGGVKVTNKNASNIDGNNKASYDAETNTLTLNGYTNSGTARADINSGVNNAAIYYNDNMSSPNPLTIQLAEGTTNSLTMTGDRVYGIYVFGSALTITGNGTLNVQSEEMAINDAWGVAITGGTVNAASSAYYGIGRVTIGADISSVTITGELGAIYGGSNEDQELINAVPGTGWTDVAGTTGQAAIAISTTGQNVSSYKKVYFTPHTHNFTYSVSGATITATCTADDCTLTDSKATLTIVAPTLTVYGGTGSAAATLDGLDAFNAATGLNVDADSIVYWKAKIIEGVYKTDGNEPLAGAPTNAGNYLAKITVSNCIASVGYTIAKADPTCTAPTGLTATYGQTLAAVTLTNPEGNTAGTWAWADSQTSVGNVVTPAATFKASFVPNDTANYNTVTNIDVTVTVNKADINPTVTLAGWTYGETANTPVVDGNTGEGAVTYTYAVKGSDNFSETVPTAVNDYTVKATIAATDNYKAGTATADFAISKAAPTVTAPVANELTYNGDAQELVTAASTEDGKLYYALGADATTAPEEGWSKDVPSAKAAGKYFVWYRVSGDSDHSDSEPVAVKVTIEQAKVTITAENKSSKREAALKALTYTVDGEIYEGDDLGIEVYAKVKPAVAGKYNIKVEYMDNANYVVTAVNGTYTVIDRITTSEKTAGKNKINSAIKATVNKNGSITAKWGAVANAEKFEVYAGYCDGSYALVKTVKGNETSFNITKINKKALNQKKSVKIYVVAYRKVNGKYEKITQSINLHVAGKKAKSHSNAKAITVKKDKFTIAVNKTATIKPTLVLENSKKKGVEHVAKFRYQSTNTAVATVDANGKITAVGKGKCTIYIFANNGKLKSVKVTVK